MTNNQLTTKIRLSADEIANIISLFKQNFSGKASLWIFGSRVNVTSRGGDIDLYMETSEKNYEQLIKQKINFLAGLKRAIGDQRIDLVINTNNSNSLAIYDKAKTNGIRLV